MSEELKAAQARIACLEGEIAKRDETIARLVPPLNRAVQANYDLREELAACRVAVENCDLFRARIAELEARIVWLECEAQVNATPVSEDKAQGEYGDAYQGAREDLAIWKRRALEAEKALQEERIITERLGNALNEENGPTFMGEPVFPAKAQGVVMQSTDGGRNPRYEGLFDGETEEQRASRLNATPVQQVSVPDGWKLVPVEPTPEMVCAAEEAHMPFGDMDIALRMAILSAPSAPAAPAADAPVRQATDGGRNQSYEGLFDGETEEQRASRLAAHSAKGVV